MIQFGFLLKKQAYTSLSFIVFAISGLALAQITESEFATVTTEGNLVSIRNGLIPGDGWQQIRPNQVGIVVRAGETEATTDEAGNVSNDTTVIIDFPTQEGFIALASELVPVIGVGMIVEPGPDWSDGNLHDDTQGVVEEIDPRGEFDLIRVRWGNNFSNRYFWSPEEHQVKAVGYGTHPQEMAPPPVFVSSKGFAEQLILGDLMSEALNANDITAVRLPAYENTFDVRNALETAAIDLYAEYNGTGLSNFFLNRGVENLDKGITNNQALSTLVVSALDAYAENINWLCITPGNNSYALAVRASWAEQNDIYDVQDLADFVNNGGEATFAGGNEFIRRPDGLITFEETYSFKFENFFDLDLEQANYESAVALRDQQSDVGALYATDGVVNAFDLVVLSDTMGAQPVYNIAPTLRQDALNRYPDIPDVLCPVFDTLDNFALSSLNARVSIDGIEPAVVAKDYLCELTATTDLSNTWFGEDPEKASTWQASCGQ